MENARTGLRRARRAPPPPPFHCLGRRPPAAKSLINAFRTSPLRPRATPAAGGPSEAVKARASPSPPPTHPTPPPTIIHQATVTYNWTSKADALAAATNWTVGDVKVKFNATAAKQNARALGNVSLSNPKNVSLVLMKPTLNLTSLLAQLDAANLSSVAFVKRNVSGAAKWWIKNGTAPALPVAWKTVLNKTVALP